MAAIALIAEMAVETRYRTVSIRLNRHCSIGDPYLQRSNWL